MRRATILILALLAAPGFGAQTLADDLSATESCLDRALGDPNGHRICVGQVSDTCQQNPEHANAMGAVHCMERETAAWDAILNARYKELRAGLAKDEATALRDMQRAWIKARDTECEMTGRIFARYSGSAGAQEGTACLRNRTAERAALLADWAMRMQDF